MLAPKTLGHPAQAKSYFAAHLDRGDYYDQTRATPGRWLGAGAARLGLAGQQVGREDFARLVEGCAPHGSSTAPDGLRSTGPDPASPEPFPGGQPERSSRPARAASSASRRRGPALTQRLKVDRRAGYDFTLSPPKSVSVAALVGGDQARLTQAHEQAVELAAAELERFAAVRVRRAGANHDRASGNLLCAAFTHQTARPAAKGLAPDPHLHTHLLVLNLSFDPSEERWKALQNAPLLAAQKYVEAVYHHSLSVRLHALGYRTEPVSRASPGAVDFRLADVAPELDAHFSKRHWRIVEETRQAQARGQRGDPKAIAAVIAHRGRQRKVTASVTQLRGAWLAQLSPEQAQGLAAVVQAAQRRSVTPRETSPGRSASAPQPANGLTPAAHTSPSESDKPASSRSSRASAPGDTAERAALDWACAHLFERQSVVAETHLLATALGRGRGAVDLGRLHAVWDGSVRDGAVLRAPTPGRTAVERSVTTRAALRDEARILGLVQAGLGRYDRLGPDRERSPSVPAPGASGTSLYRAADSASTTPHNAAQSRPAATAGPPASTGASSPGLKNQSQDGTVTPTATTPLRDPPTLDAFQQNALSEVLRSRDFVTLLRGGAGRGKSLLLRAIAAELGGVSQPANRAEERSGRLAAAGRRPGELAESTRLLIVLTPQARQAAALRAEGLSQAQTLARWLASFGVDASSLRGAAHPAQPPVPARPGLNSSGPVILVDEAGQLGSRTTRALLERAHSLDARVILCGDRRQHGPVEAGDALRAIESLTPTARADLGTDEAGIYRQMVPWYRSAVALAEAGASARSFLALQRAGAIHEIAADERVTRVATLAAQRITAGESVLVLSQTNREVDLLNEAIRQRVLTQVPSPAAPSAPAGSDPAGSRQDTPAGQPPREEHLFWTQRPLDATHAQKREASTYRGRDVVLVTTRRLVARHAPASAPPRRTGGPAGAQDCAAAAELVLPANTPLRFVRLHEQTQAPTSLTSAWTGNGQKTVDSPPLVVVSPAALPDSPRGTPGAAAGAGGREPAAEWLLDEKALASCTLYERRALALRVGDQLLVRRNLPRHGLANGELVRVAGFESVAPARPRHLAAPGHQRKGDLDFASTSTVTETNAAGQTAPNQPAVNPAGVVVVADGRGRAHRLDAAAGELFVVRGYATTSYGAQGQTADHVILSDSAVAAATNQAQWYVAISRGRRAVSVFTSDAAALRQHVARLSQRLLAHELMARTNTPAQPGPGAAPIAGASRYPEQHPGQFSSGHGIQNAFREHDAQASRQRVPTGTAFTSPGWLARQVQRWGMGHLLQPAVSWWRSLGRVMHPAAASWPSPPAPSGSVAPQHPTAADRKCSATTTPLTALALHARQVRATLQATAVSVRSAAGRGSRPTPVWARFAGRVPDSGRGVDQERL